LAKLNKGKDIPHEIVAAARPGQWVCLSLHHFSTDPIHSASYSERGAAVIKNTLMGMYDLLAPTKTSASDPLRLDTYCDFMVIPYITAWLIGEDNNTNVDWGWEIMQLQGDRGNDENRLMDDDPALDAVWAVNAKQRRAMDQENGKNVKQPQKQKGARVTKANKENPNPLYVTHYQVPIPCYLTRRQQVQPQIIKIETWATRSGARAVTLQDFPVVSVHWIIPSWSSCQITAFRKEPQLESGYREAEFEEDMKQLWPPLTESMIATCDSVIPQHSSPPSSMIVCRALYHTDSDFLYGLKNMDSYRLSHCSVLFCLFPIHKVGLLSHLP
jgi:hypothetical protein